MKITLSAGLLLLCACVSPTPEQATMKEEYQKQLKPWETRLPAEWKALEKSGVTDQTQLRLGFHYSAPGEKEARSLQVELDKQTDYELEIGEADEGGLWWLKGRTRETPLTFVVLTKWINWMIGAGVTHGCHFDDWGVGVDWEDR